MFSFRRTSAVAGVVAALTLGLAGSAMATPTVARDSGLAPMNVPGGVNSDCGIRTQLINDPGAGGHVYARGYASCSNAKSGIMVETLIKRTLSDGTVQTYTSGGHSTLTPEWVGTGWLFSGCDRYQAVTRAWITDGYNRQTYNYVTSGAPAKFLDHCIM
jgi:hypothetical protein